MEWDEQEKGLKMADFTIFNTMEPIESLGDIFKPVLGKGIDLEAISKASQKAEKHNGYILLEIIYELSMPI